jgi:quinol-cytochrome oxidoreductase complex cytochrome b subunit
MADEIKYEAGVSSDARKDPVRVVFLTSKTSAAVKSDNTPRLMSYPHLLLREMLVFEALSILMVLLALLWDAPLEQVANPLLTPNPAKAPWYFLGLQELLHYFPPIVAGIIIPGLIVVALIVIPYFDVNIKGEPLWFTGRNVRLWAFEGSLALMILFLSFYRAWTVAVPTALVAALAFIAPLQMCAGTRLGKYLRMRPLSWWIMTWFVAVSSTLTTVGTFFRGPGWSWVWPWR